MPHARSLHLTPIHQLVLFNSLQFVFTPTFNSVATYRYSNTVPRFGLVTVYNNISVFCRHKEPAVNGTVSINMTRTKMPC